MGRHKQTPGFSYHIDYQDDCASVRCGYECPYCEQLSISYFTVDTTEGYEILEQGAFYQHLTCEMCGEVSTVRFWPSNRN